jgi:hypothetical protein
MDIVEQGINERCTAKAMLELYEFLRRQMCGYMVWLQDGVKETGVSVAYTVRAMDSGPIIASGHMDVDPDIKAPELLSLLFKKGTCAICSYCINICLMAETRLSSTFN